MPAGYHIENYDISATCSFSASILNKHRLQLNTLQLGKMWKLIF